MQNSLILSIFIFFATITTTQLRALSHFKNETLYSPNNNNPYHFPLFLPIATLLSVYSYDFEYFKYLMYVRLYRICLFVNGISLSTISWSFIQDVPCVEISFLLKLNSIQLYVYITFCLYSHPSVHTSFASTF